MTVARKLTKQILLDENGLLLEPDNWNKDVARLIATDLGIYTLTDDHWKIINTLRQHYDRFGVAPAMFNVCNSHHQPGNWVHDHFHTCLNAWRVAGLPDPGEEAKSYLSDM